MPHKTFHTVITTSLTSSSNPHPAPNPLADMQLSQNAEHTLTSGPVLHLNIWDTVMKEVQKTHPLSYLADKFSPCTFWKEPIYEWSL